MRYICMYVFSRGSLFSKRNLKEILMFISFVENKLNQPEFLLL